MSFGAVAFTTGLILLVLAAIAVAGLYLLRPPPARLVVPSVQHWRRIAERQRSSDLLRRLLSALLSLLIVWAIVAAITGLRFGQEGEATLQLVIDDSATMAARAAGGETRLQRAVDQAGDLAANWPGRVLLTSTSGRAGAHLTSDAAKARAWLSRLKVHADAEPRLPDPELGAPARRVLFTDGVGLAPDARFEVHSVFETARNVGVTGLDARELAAGGWEVPVEVTNGSLTTERVDLVIETADGEPLVKRELELASGDVWSARLELGSGLAVAELRARIEGRDGPDALTADDSATTVLGEPARITVHHAGSEELARVLRAMPEVELVPGTPTRPDDERAGVTIFEGAAPEEVPVTPTLLIAPPPRGWLPPRVAREEPAPKLEEVSTPGGGRWAGLEVEDWIEFELPDARRETTDDSASPRTTVLLSATPVAEPESAGREESRVHSVPLAFVQETGEAAVPVGVVAFDIANSSAPFEDGLPILLSQLVHQLGEHRAFGTGRSEAGYEPVAATPRSATLINHTVLTAEPAPSSPPSSAQPSALSAAVQPHVLLLLVLGLLVLESLGRRQGVTE